MCRKYTEELFGLLVQISEGEARMVVKDTTDREEIPDGFKAMLMYAERFGNQTTGNVLQLLLNVVSPSKISNREVSQGIYKWEARVPALASKQGETGTNIVDKLTTVTIEAEGEYLILFLMFF